METNKEKHLFQLSIAEFVKLYREVLVNISSEALMELLNNKLPKKTIERDAISVKETSEITGLKINSIYSKVSRSEIPVLSRGKPLRFSRSAIEKWLRTGRPTQFQEGKKRNNK